MSKKFGQHDRLPMQYLIIEATKHAPDGSIVEEASVGCWIKEQTRRNAYYIAKGWIEAEGWEIVHLEDQHLITEEAYRNSPEESQYFEQAQIDGEVFVFFTSPAE